MCISRLLFIVNNPRVSTGTISSQYNPKYADAIEMQKPEFCHEINYALQSGPTDAIDKLYGDEAVKLCERQATTGGIGCECNEASVLNDMRKKW